MDPVPGLPFFLSLLLALLYLPKSSLQQAENATIASSPGRLPDPTKLADPSLKPINLPAPGYRPPITKEAKGGRVGLESTTSRSTTSQATAGTKSGTTETASASGEISPTAETTSSERRRVYELIKAFSAAIASSKLVVQNITISLPNYNPEAVPIADRPMLDSGAAVSLNTGAGQGNLLWPCTPLFYYYYPQCSSFGRK